MRDEVLRIASEAPLQDNDGALAVGMQKAEVAGPAKAFGQDMPDHQVEEARARQGAVFEALSLGMTAAEGHPAVLAGEDALLPDDAEIEVAPNVAAVPTLCPHQGTGRCAAALQGVQGIAFTGQDRLPVRGPIVGLEGGDDGGEQDHFTPLQWREKSLITSLMACSALQPVRALRWVERAVVRME